MSQQMISIQLLSGAALLVPNEVAEPILLAALTKQAPVAVQPATDNLEWSHTLCDGKRVTFAEAEKAIAALGQGWRMATRKEMESILDLSRHDPAIDKSRFPDTKSEAYWTSTPCAWNTSAVWLVAFDAGDSDVSSRNYDACVRAVRSLPSGQ